MENIVKDSESPAASCERTGCEDCLKARPISEPVGSRSRASTFDKSAVVPIEIQSPDPQDSAEYDAWIRQRFDRQSSVNLTSTSRFLRSSTSTKRSMRQRCYKGQFQLPKPFTENSGDASGAVYRHRRQYFREQAEASAVHRHSTKARSLDVRCDATQVPTIQNH